MSKDPSNTIGKIVSFLADRSHTTKTDGTESSALTINHSIVQESAYGPTFYIISQSDLKSASNVNIYANDTNLLVPERNILTSSSVTSMIL